MTRLPVHCCCEPAKRLGWVELPDDLCRPGRISLVALPTFRGSMIAGNTEITPRIDINTEIRELRVERVLRGTGEREPLETVLAVKSAHQALCVWKRVHGFIVDNNSEGA